MKLLGYLPLDSVFKSALRCLEKRGHEVVSTFTFGEFRKRLRTTDTVLMNYTKNDTPRYLWKVLISVLLARLAGKPLILFMSIDPFDLCDLPFQKLYLWTINKVVCGTAVKVGVLTSRRHIFERYSVPEAKQFVFDNYPDPEIWQIHQDQSLARLNVSAESSTRSTAIDSTRQKVEKILNEIQSSGVWREKTIYFLYHGELLWWHGLELFLKVEKQIRSQGWKTRIIVAGHLYNSNFKCLGLTATRKEPRIKERLKQFLNRENVTWLGRIEQPEVRRLMSACDFHITQLRGGNIQAETELRTCLLEAMKAGMVCLHLPTAALRKDVFEHERNIAVIDPAHPEEAAEIIISLYQSEEKRLTIGRAASETIDEHYNIERWITSLERLLKTCSVSARRK